MFVVRVENDEATMYRAFRRMQAAQAWAAEKNDDELDCLVDIIPTPDALDAKAAVAAARRERSTFSVYGGALIGGLLPLACGADGSSGTPLGV